MNISELKIVLKDYLENKNPMYSTMIAGPWCCGKTTFIKKALNEFHQNYLYISLYGVNSIDEIKDRIFTSFSSIEGISEQEISKVGQFVKGVTSIFNLA